MATFQNFVTFLVFQAIAFMVYSLAPLNVRAIRPSENERILRPLPGHGAGGCNAGIVV